MSSINFPTISQAEVRKFYPWASGLNTHFERKTISRMVLNSTYKVYFKDRLALELILLTDLKKSPLFINRKDCAVIVELVLSGKLSSEDRSFKSLMNILNPYGLKKETLQVLCKCREFYHPYSSPVINRVIKEIFRKVYEEGVEDGLEVYIEAMEAHKIKMDASRAIKKEAERLKEQEELKKRETEDKIKQKLKEEKKREDRKKLGEFKDCFIEYRKVSRSNKLAEFNTFLRDVKGLVNLVPGEYWSKLLHWQEEGFPIL